MEVLVQSNLISYLNNYQWERKRPVTSITRERDLNSMSLFRRPPLKLSKRHSILPKTTLTRMILLGSTFPYRMYLQQTIYLQSKNWRQPGDFTLFFPDRCLHVRTIQDINYILTSRDILFCNAVLENGAPIDLSSVLSYRSIIHQNEMWVIVVDTGSFGL